MRGGDRIEEERRGEERRGEERRAPCPDHLTADGSSPLPPV